MAIPRWIYTPLLSSMVQGRAVSRGDLDNADGYESYP